MSKKTISIDSLFTRLEHSARWLFAHRITVYKGAGVTAAIALVIAGSVFGYSWWKSNAAEAAWFDDAWTRRRAITITNSTGSDLTNFQVQVLENYDLSSDVSAGVLQSDLDDIRFTDADGTLLNHWVEDVTNSSANVWVKIPTVTAGTNATTVYMYYGNSSAGTASNGFAVFDFFDDFETGSLVHWDIPSTWGVSSTAYGGSYAAYYSGGPISMSAYLSTTTRAVVEFNTRLNETNKYHYPFRGPGGYTFVALNTGYFGYYTGGSYTGLPVSTAYAANTWYKVKLVLDTVGNTYAVYIDGSDKGDVTNNSLFNSASDITVFTALNASSGQTAGMYMDNVFVRQYASAEPTVTVNAAEAGGGPVAYWSFDEGYASTTYDRVGTAHGTLQSDTQWVEGKFGKALSFDGTDDSVSMGNVMDITTGSFSVSAIAKQAHFNDTSYRAIVMKRSGQSVYSGYRLTFNRTAQTIWNPDFFVSDSITTGSHEAAQALSSVNIYNSNNFYHLVGVWDAGTKTAYIYVDGQLTGSAQDTDIVTLSNAANLTIGNSSLSTARNFPGIIDEVKFFNRALDADDIKSLYAGGTGKSGEGAGALLGGANQNNRFGDPGLVTDGLVGYWKFDETSAWGSTVGAVKDFSGMNNHGTSTNATTTADKAKYGRSAGFNSGDGSSDYITTAPDIYSGLSRVTMGGWFYSNSTASDQLMYSVEGAYGLYYNNGALLAFFDGDTTGDSAWGSGYGNSTWHHFVARHDGTTTTLFVDGVQIGSRAESLYNLASLTGRAVAFGGQYNGGSSFFNGYLDDIKIWNKALSNDEIMREYVAGPGPVGHWRFEEGQGTTAYDQSGNFNNGTLTGGPTWDIGKVGNAVKFDGTNDYVSVSNSASLNLTTSITLSAWIYPKTGFTSGYRSILYAGDLGTGYDLGTTITTGKLLAWFAGTSFTSTQQLSADRWTFVSASYDGSQTKLHINGSLDSSTAKTGSMTTGFPVTIGMANDATTYPFTGYIDEVKIYNYARTPRQIALDYNGGGPVGYWSFDEGYASTTYDGSGQGNNGTLQDNTLWNMNGKFGKALDFDGTNDAVSLGTGSLFDLTGPLSISSWAKFNSLTGSNYDHIFENEYYNYNGTTCKYEGYSLAHYASNIRFNVRYGSGSLEALYPITNLQTGQWYHIAGTLDDANLRLYIDGRLVDTEASSGNYPAYCHSFTKYIGQTYNGTYDFNGSIDDVKIYSYARTPEEIRQDYNSTGGLNGASANLGGQFTKSERNPTRGDGLVGHWKFDETTAWGATSGAVKDSSGAGNHGTATNATTTTDQAKYGRAMGADGTGDYIQIADSASLDLTTELTVQAWVKHRTTGVYDGILNKGAFNSTFGRYALWVADNDTVRFSVNNDSGVAANYVYGTSSIGTNWAHVTATYNQQEGKLRLYINGRLDAEANYSGTITADTTNLRIGSYYSTSFDWNGYIDDVKIYNKARSATEIMRDYAEGPPPVASWRFEEGQGTTANDQSGNLNTGTLTNGPDWAIGKVGGALEFDGTDDYVSINDSTAVSLPGFFSLQAWVYPQTLDASYQEIIGKYNASVTNYELRINSSNQFEFGYQTAASVWSAVASAAAAQASQWQHVVGLFDGSTMKIFVNGVQSNSQARTANPGTSSSALHIGRRNADFYFDGLVDEVKIYDYARTARQVSYDYNNGKPIAQWTFDKGSGGTLHDESGNNNHGTIYPGTAGSNSATSSMWSTAGKINGALSFDGTDDYVSVGSVDFQTDLTNAVTVAGWFYLTADSTDQRLLQKQISDGWSSFGLWLYSDNKISWTVQNSSLVQYPTWSSAKTVSSGWHHIVGTFEKNAVSSADGSIYIDGEKVSTTYAAQSYASTFSIQESSNNLIFGARPVTLTSFFQGKMDDVKIYNYARTPEEVRQDYGGGSVRF